MRKNVHYIIIFITFLKLDTIISITSSSTYSTNIENIDLINHDTSLYPIATSSRSNQELNYLTNEEEDVHKNDDEELYSDYTLHTNISPINDISINTIIPKKEENKEWIEPICRADPKRFALFPIKQPIMWNMYKKHMASFWTPEGYINLYKFLYNIYLYVY
jgi:hypothetical protein